MIGLIGVADKVLDMAVLHGRRIVPSLHFDQARLLNGFLVVSVSDAGMLQYIPRIFLMKPGRAFFHGLLYIQHEGVLLILYLNGPKSLAGGHFVFCNNRGHIVTVEPDTVRQYQAVRHVLMAFLRRPGVACGRKIILRHVKASNHLDHARYLPGILRIYGYDLAVCDCGMQYLRDICAFVAEVVRILCIACNLVKGVDPPYAGANNFSAFLHPITSRISLFLLHIFP